MNGCLWVSAFFKSVHAAISIPKFSGDWAPDLDGQNMSMDQSFVCPMVPHVWASAIWTQWFLIDVRICNSLLSPFWLFPIPLVFDEIPFCLIVKSPKKSWWMPSSSLLQSQLFNLFSWLTAVKWHPECNFYDETNGFMFSTLFHMFSTFFHHVHPPFWWFLHELTMLTTGVGASRAFRACQTGSPGGCRQHSDARRMATSGMRRFSLWKIHPDGNTRWWYR